MTVVFQMNFCENFRTFDRFASNRQSLRRLGYDNRQVRQLMEPEKRQWLHDNVPVGYHPQEYAYPCADNCEQCQGAYIERRVQRVHQSVSAFIRLFEEAQKHMEFQSCTVPDYAPFPDHVHDVLHATEETDSYYCQWFEGYLFDREVRYLESLERCLARWRERGVVRASEDGDGFETVPISFPSSVLSKMPDSLLQRSDVQRVCGIITNRFKRQFEDELAARSGYSSIDEAWTAVPEEEAGRFLGLIREYCLYRLREVKKPADGELLSEFQQDIADWFVRSRALMVGHIHNDIGYLDNTETWQREVHDAWIFHCWEQGWLSPVANYGRWGRRYLPLHTRRETTVQGRPVVRLEFGQYDADGNLVLEPAVSSLEPVPKDMPAAAVVRLPSRVLTEQLKLYRKRVRRAGLRFHYAGVEELGNPEKSFHHFHAVVGFCGIDVGDTDAVKSARVLMAECWHKVSGNVIWKRGRWSEPVRNPKKTARYAAKYISKHFSHSDGHPRRLVRTSPGLGLKHFNREEYIIQQGLVPDRALDVTCNLTDGAFFHKRYPEYAFDIVGSDIWVGIKYLQGEDRPRFSVSSHYRVDAVARCPDNPSSVGKAKAIKVFHRLGGEDNVVREKLTWLSWAEFHRLASHSVPSGEILPEARSAASRLLFRLHSSALHVSPARALSLQDSPDVRSVKLVRHRQRHDDILARFRALLDDAEHFLSCIPPPPSARDGPLP